MKFSMDRLVKEIKTSGSLQEGLKPFSSYLNQPNIVLLGDPGLGKTHLFEKASESEHGKYTTARRFSVLGKNKYAGGILYIDALDESRPRLEGKRSGIDEIIKLLVDIPAEKIRLSCRTADWLGDSDLLVFDECYFKDHGGYIVLELQPLTENEIDHIILQCNAQSSKKINPLDFRKEADVRGVAALLRNPQTLIMLITAIQKNGNWPKTKKELYFTCCKNLLQEHNIEHSRIKDSLGITETELLDAAGAAYASMLIAGIDEIKLSGYPDDEAPFYTEVPGSNKRAILTALISRAFTSVVKDEKITFVHRTIAEFLAAQWLAKMISEGLPLKCVQSFMGIGEQPAFQLRGLHAWLATFLKEEDAQVLIAADPYGILIYGDAAAFSSQNRKFLLNSLEMLCEHDPWFRSQHWSSEPCGALCGNDMIEEFKRILSFPQEYYHLRSIILDAIENGHPQIELLDTLRSIMCDENLPYGERISALESIEKIEPNGIRTIVDCAKSNLSDESSSLRLRIYAICKFYEGNFEPKDILNVLDCLLTNKDRRFDELFWEIEKLLPLSLLSIVLDFIANHSQCKNLNHNSINAYHIVQLFSGLLEKTLQSGESIRTNNLWDWLETLHDLKRNVGYGYSGKTQNIKEYFFRNKNKIMDVFKCAVNGFSKYVNYIHFLQVFNDATEGSATDSEIIQEAIFIIQISEHITERENFLFELSLVLIFKSNPPNCSLFEKLYNLSEKDPSLIKICERLNSWPIEGCRQLYLNKNIREDEEQNTEKWRASFTQFRDEIRNGTHAAFLGEIACFYFAFYSDVNKNDSPHTRLNAIFGEEYTLIALQGLRAAIYRNDIPLPKEVVANKKQVYWWWQAIVAGMDEQWLENPDISAYSVNVLSSALAINIVLPTDLPTENRCNPIARQWKKTFFQYNFSSAQAVFSEIIRTQLERNDDYIQGLDEALHDEYLSAHAGKLALECLRDFPNTNVQTLRSLLLTVYSDGFYLAELSNIIESVISLGAELGENQYAIWLAAGFFLNFDKFKDTLENDFPKNTHILWKIKEFTQAKLFQLTNEQIYFLIDLIGTHYPNVDRPQSSMGLENSWNAAEFVNRLIQVLSESINCETEEYLKKLHHTDNHNLSTYREYLKHAGANQLRLSRQNEFTHLSWGKTIEILRGQDPVNSHTLYAMTIHHLKNIQKKIRQDNTDKYKRFWNEDEHGKVTNPKIEPSCQDILIDLLRCEFNSHKVIIDPEGHMVADGRADIALASTPNTKILIELKRDTHPDLWKAYKEQLQEYVQDSATNGYGIYGVFWFGEKRVGNLPSPPEGTLVPSSAAELERCLTALIDTDKRHRITVIVIDVSPMLSPSKQKKSNKATQSEVPA